MRLASIVSYLIGAFQMYGHGHVIPCWKRPIISINPNIGPWKKNFHWSAVSSMFWQATPFSQDISKAWSKCPHKVTTTESSHVGTSPHEHLFMESRYLFTVGFFCQPLKKNARHVAWCLFGFDIVALATTMNTTACYGGHQIWQPSNRTLVERTFLFFASLALSKKCRFCTYCNDQIKWTLRFFHFEN